MAESVHGSTEVARASSWQDQRNSQCAYGQGGRWDYCQAERRPTQADRSEIKVARGLQGGGIGQQLRDVRKDRGELNGFQRLWSCGGWRGRMQRQDLAAVGENMTPLTFRRGRQRTPQRGVLLL